MVESTTNHPFEIREMTQNNTISSLANTTSNQLVNIKGQLTKLFGSKKVFTRSGSVTKQEGLISDATGTIKVVFWEDFVNAAKESMTYAFKQFIYKNDQYGIYIATSKSAPSSLEETEQIKEPLAKPTIGQEILTNKELLVDLLGVSSATQYSSCCSCKKKLQTQKNSLTAHCASCNLTQKIKHCSSKTANNLVISSTLLLSTTLCSSQQPNVLFWTPWKPLQPRILSTNYLEELINSKLCMTLYKRKLLNLHKPTSVLELLPHVLNFLYIRYIIVLQITTINQNLITLYLCNFRLPFRKVVNVAIAPIKLEFVLFGKSSVS